MISTTAAHSLQHRNDDHNCIAFIDSLIWTFLISSLSTGYKIVWKAVPILSRAGLMREADIPIRSPPKYACSAGISDGFWLMVQAILTRKINTKYGKDVACRACFIQDINQTSCYRIQSITKFVHHFLLYMNFMGSESTSIILERALHSSFFTTGTI